MNSHISLRTFALVGAAAIFLTACDSGSKQAAPVQQQPAQPAVPGVPDLTPDQRAAIEKVFAEARVWVEQARAARLAGEEAMRAGDMDMQAAIPHFQEAIPLYRKSSQHVEDWIEPDFGKITEAQRDAFLRSYLSELNKWQKEMASMGKVPPKE